MPPESVIKADLEYVCKHWQEPCFDYWEEVEATHFATRMAQRRALLDGARLAERLGDPGAASHYRDVAAQITSRLHAHWGPSDLVIRPARSSSGSTSSSSTRQKSRQKWSS